MIIIIIVLIIMIMIIVVIVLKVGGRLALVLGERFEWATSECVYVCIYIYI